jgi:hypothetical protein
LFGVALLVVLFAACDYKTPPAQNYATVVGRVYDATTNAPVAGAVITISTVLTAVTGPDGVYRVNDVPIGQNEIQIQAPAGYAVVQPGGLYPIAPQPGETLRQDIPLAKRP